jgi:RNase H-like domain found in reverse transcriptase/Reverse transcriptase (RNA-dependent DNA polymerase)
VETAYRPITDAMCRPTDCIPTIVQCNCAVIYENDVDFGNITVIDPPLYRQAEILPSQKLSPEKLAHLTPTQRMQLLEVLDRHAEVFSEVPGLCMAVQHEIPISADFKPKRLRAYKVPEAYQAEVSRQIQELLSLGFIEASTSPQASPLVVVLKAKDKDGNRAVRLAIDYRYVNKHTAPSVSPLEDISEIIQQVGKSNFISSFDTKSGYHQCLVRPEDRWLTSFICNDGQFQWTRTPFGMRSSGSTFVRAVKGVLSNIRDYTKSYVDDMAVHSDSFNDHLHHVDRYLYTMKSAGFTLELKKSEFVKPKIRFVGHIIGSGNRSVDPEKVAAVHELKEPETKRQVRQLIGFFSFFREYIPNFATICKPLTDLTTKRIADRVPFGYREREAFSALKHLLCTAASQPLNIIDVTKQFSLFVDASNYAVGAALTQPDAGGNERPIAFASSKLSETQQRWATIEKEAYAALWALQKYKYWLYGRSVILYSDHNPITFLTETTPKSSKLMRWHLALQEFDVQFRFRKGSTNEAADCLSRMVKYEDGDYQPITE